MSVHQINGNYIETEDRLLFRLTTTDNEEIRLWLSRRVTAALMSIGETVSVSSLEAKHPPVIAKVLDDFQQEKIEASVNTEALFECKSKLPLGATPILVLNAMLAEHVQHKPNTVAIQLKLSNQQDLNLKLTQTEVNQLRTFLQLMWKKTGWGEGPEKRPPQPLGALLTPKLSSVH